VVAATTEPDKVDESALRPGRMGKMIYVGPPDMETRIEVLKMYLSDRPVEIIDPAAVFEETKKILSEQQG
jgi:SpoVK/Ycf46/Vps4 family AAA+-type ATPase